MTRAVMLVLLLAAVTVAPAEAREADEYLQSTLLSIDAREVAGELKLVPRVEAWPAVMTVIDVDANGRIDGPEMQAYARAVLRDLSLQVDGTSAPLELRSIEFAPLESFQEGGGEIRVAFGAMLRDGAPRAVVYENRHRIASPAYRADVLPPKEPALTLTHQRRSDDASRLELQFVSASGLHPWTRWLALALLAGAVVAAAAWLVARRAR